MATLVVGAVVVCTMCTLHGSVCSGHMQNGQNQEIVVAAGQADNKII